MTTKRMTMTTMKTTNDNINHDKTRDDYRDDDDDDDDKEDDNNKRRAGDDNNDAKKWIGRKNCWLRRESIFIRFEALKNKSQ